MAQAATTHQAPAAPHPIFGRMAEKYGVDPVELSKILKATAFKGPKIKDSNPPRYREATDEELVALLIVAESYGLNPFTKEIYAFPDEKRGGIVPVVSIDGWLRIINSHPAFRGQALEFHGFELPPNDPTANPYIECTMLRSDRDLPIVHREWMNECWRDTVPWQSHPKRMLQWKAIIQTARIGFGFAGLYDLDEAERIRDANVIEGEFTEQRRAKPLTRPPRALTQTFGNPANFAKLDAPAEVVGAEQGEPADGNLQSRDAEMQSGDATPGPTVNLGQLKTVRAKLDHAGIAENAFLAQFELGRLEDLPFAQLNDALTWIGKNGA